MGISIASRWPVRELVELDLKVTDRTTGFPCTCLIAEISAPQPIGDVLLVNHFPDYHPHHEHERELQTVIVARHLEQVVAVRDIHIVLAGDLDAASIRFLTGRQSLHGISVCYRDAWESVHGAEPGHTFSTRNGLMAQATWDWSFRQIDHILVRCGQRHQPALRITTCEVALDQPVDGVWASDHFALVADLELP